MADPPSRPPERRTFDGMDNRDEVRDFLTTRRERLTPEQRARVRIDAMLEAAGWELQDYSGPIDFQAAAGVAIREFETKTGPVYYLLVAEGRVVGSVEAKPE